MMRKNVVALWLVLCFLLCACGVEDAVANSSEGNLLPERKKVQDVFVGYAQTVFVGTNAEEKAAILDLLYSTDLNQLQDAELTGITGSAVYFKLCTDDYELSVRILEDSNAQYFVTESQNHTLIVKKCPVGLLPSYADLSRMITDVLSNEKDPIYSGTVEIVGSDFNARVNKGNCAYAKHILDDALTQASSTETGDIITTYNVLFTVGETVYGINSDTGYFFKEEAGERIYSCVGKGRLMELKIRIGVRTATSK